MTSAPAQYWNQIAKSQNAQDTISSMRAYPEWMSLRDENGRSPWMHALLHCGNNKICTQINSKPAIVKMGSPDAQGRNLWFYVCRAGSRQFNHHMNGAEENFLNQLELMRPSSLDAHGRGIAIQLLLDPATDTKATPTVLHEGLLEKVAQTGNPWQGSEVDIIEATAKWRDLCLHIPGLNAQDMAFGHTINLADGLNKLAALYPPTGSNALSVALEISQWACSGGYLDEADFDAAPKPVPPVRFLKDHDLQAMRNYISWYQREDMHNQEFATFASEIESRILNANLPANSNQKSHRKPRL